MEAVLSAAIVALGSIIVQLIIAAQNRHKTHEEQAVYRARLESTLKNIETKLDEHNAYAEKIGALKDSMLLIQQDVKYIKEGKL